MGFVVPCYMLLLIHLKVSSSNMKRNNTMSETCNDLSLHIYKEKKNAVRYESPVYQYGFLRVLYAETEFNKMTWVS